MLLRGFVPAPQADLAGLKTVHENEHCEPSFAILHSNEEPVDDGADTRAAQRNRQPSMPAARKARKCIYLTLPTRTDP